jgi:hypothetical protein
LECLNLLRDEKANSSCETRGSLTRIIRVGDWLLEEFTYRSGSSGSGTQTTITARVRQRTLKVAITIAEAAPTISDRTIQTINDLANMTLESRARIREMLYADAVRAEKEAAFGNPTPPPERPPRGFLRRLLWRPTKYRFVELAPDDPRHPCYLPNDADSIDGKVTWLEFRIDENFDVEQRFALLDCRPEWDEEHGRTIIIRSRNAMLV